MSRLQDIGWDDFFACQPLNEKYGDQVFVARVSRHDGQEYDILTPDAQTRRARLGGGLRYRAQTPQELPAVGDWVAVRDDEGDLKTIVDVFDRRTCFVRQAAGQVTEEQVIAANVDTVFVVTSMNEEFEPRRLERYLTAIRAAGARPVIVLNKRDLADDPQAFVDAAHQVADSAPVVSMSALEGDAEVVEDTLGEWLGRGQTVVFVGSSGVGKSTLVNRLVGEDVQITSDIREDDAKGRHTTTTRQLLVLPHRPAVLIDTPGMREFQLWAYDEETAEAFEDIEELEFQCRFRDCRHDSEPGCAVRAALESGELSAERLASWQKLQRELDAQQRRQEDAARRQKGSKRR